MENGQFCINRLDLLYFCLKPLFCFLFPLWCPGHLSILPGAKTGLKFVIKNLLITYLQNSSKFLYGSYKHLFNHFYL